MIYIVGCNHLIQHNAELFTEKYTQKKKKEIDDFKQYICKNIHQYNISVLAEELNETCLLDGTESNLKSVADEVGKKHLFCEPTLEIKNELGIDNKKKREKYWLKMISPYSCQNIIFVCGMEHLVTFPNLLKKNNLNVKILKSGWGVKLHKSLLNKIENL